MFLQRCFSNSLLRFGALFGAVLSSKTALFVSQCVASRLHLRLRTWGIAVKEDEHPSFWTLVVVICTGVALLVGLFDWRRMRRRLSSRCNLRRVFSLPADGNRFPEDSALPPVSLYPVSPIFSCTRSKYASLCDKRSGGNFHFRCPQQKRSVGS
jgi:hypothetical protein